MAGLDSFVDRISVIVAVWCFVRICLYFGRHVRKFVRHL